MKNEPFHNTINAEGQILIKYESEALTQEDLVVKAFKKAQRPLAWFEIKNLLGGDMDECSLKRATSNLTTDRKDKEGNIIKPKTLQKTTEMVTGPKGKPCHRYSLITQNNLIN